MIIEQTEMMSWTNFLDKWGRIAIENASTWDELVSIIQSPKPYPSKEDCPHLSLSTFGSSLYLMMQPFMQTEPQDVQDLAAAVPAGAVIFFDTLNRAVPTADENSSKDMGRILHSAKTLQALTGGLVVLVHHTGRDSPKGLRGHSSLFAAMDAAIEVSLDGERRAWRAAKSKDGQDSGSHQLTLEIKTLGTDEYGEVTSCVIPPTFGQVHEAKRKARHQNGMDTFNAASVSGADAGRDPWQDTFYSRSTTESADAKRKAFNRAVTDLVKLEKLNVANDLFSVPCLF